MRAVAVNRPLVRPNILITVGGTALHEVSFGSSPLLEQGTPSPMVADQMRSTSGVAPGGGFGGPTFVKTG